MEPLSRNHLEGLDQVLYTKRLVWDVLDNQSDSMKFSKFMQSFQMVFTISALIFIVFMFVMIYKLFVKIKGIERTVNKSSDCDNQLEVIVDNPRKDAFDNNGSKVTNNRPSFVGTYSKRSDGQRANDSFGTKMSKNSDDLKSIPESSQVHQSLQSQELMNRMSFRSEEVSGRPSEGSRTDSSLFSDTIIKIDRIIDETFDGIINSVIDNPQTNHSSYED